MIHYQILGVSGIYMEVNECSNTSVCLREGSGICLENHYVLLHFMSYFVF